jgi:phosphoserine phosphatase
VTHRETYRKRNGASRQATPNVQKAIFFVNALFHFDKLSVMAMQKPERNHVMKKTLTLISSLKDACITETLAASVGNILQSSPEWLYPSVACDYTVPPHLDPLDAHKAVVGLVREAKVDVVLQAADNRRKKLFLADMDSTIIGQECIDELAAELGIKDKVATITEAAMNGEIDFEGALKDRVALLAGLDEAIVSKVLEKRITINDGARQALAVMRNHGTHTALVSGGFTVFAREIAQETGFHEFHANTLLSEDGKFTGKVQMPILGQQAKLDQLSRLAREKGVSLSETIAIGDGANDLPMLLNAGTGIAFHAKPTVSAKAEFIINHGDLSSILFVQGYGKEEFDKVL